MKCAIMQPTYLPWSGYFHLATEVDYFIILDDVQFNKRSWQQRNRILQNGQEIILTVPVFNKGKRQQLIKEVIINNESDWKKSHLKSIEMAYGRSIYKHQLFPLLDEMYSYETDSLSDFNIKFIQLIFNLLNIKAKLVLSSELNSTGKKSEYLLNICNELNCNEYLSPVGSKEYIEEEGLFEASDINVSFQNFEVREYPQLNSKQFISHLSIIDVIFNIGVEETQKYIKQ